MLWSKGILRTLLATTIVASASCDRFLDVTNPGVIDITAIDLAGDADVLSGTAMQNMAYTHSWGTLVSGYFAGEVDVASNSGTLHEYPRRALDEWNFSLLVDIWISMGQAISSAYLVLELDLPEPERNINLVRAHHAAGWMLLDMADQFCTGVIRGGHELTTEQILDTAVVHFTSVIDKGTAASTAEGDALAQAAYVGRARAHLQAGRNAEALADAQRVRNGFSYHVRYADDFANRDRFGNKVWEATEDGAVSVAPMWRIGDPRVAYIVDPPDVNPSNAAYALQRGAAFAIPTKYQSYGAPIRLASDMEAQYIAAEASGTAAMLQLIQDRRAANGQPEYGGGTDAASVLRAFHFERGLEFFLEGKRMGDYRRNPDAVAGVFQPGTPYWHSAFSAVQDQGCFPIPAHERNVNENL